MKPHERRATGQTTFYKLAAFDAVSQCYRDGKTQYETVTDAMAAATEPNRYVVTVCDDSGRHQLVQFDVRR